MLNMVVGTPMERIHLHLTGPHPSVGGFTYICTALCAFTKYAVAWPIRDKKATTVAKGLMEKVIVPFGAPLCCSQITARSLTTSCAKSSVG